MAEAMSRRDHVALIAIVKRKADITPMIEEQSSYETPIEMPVVFILVAR